MNQNIESGLGFINKYGRPIEVLATLLTLIFIAYQTLQMNLNIDAIKQSVVLDSHQAVHNHRQRVNRILLENDPNLAEKVFETDKPNLVGYTIVTDYESLFNMRCSRLLPDEMWHDIETMIYNTMTGVPFMRKFWLDKKPSVSGKFSDYINRLTNAKIPNRGKEKDYCNDE